MALNPAKLVGGLSKRFQVPPKLNDKFDHKGQVIDFSLESC